MKNVIINGEEIVVNADARYEIKIYRGDVFELKESQRSNAYLAQNFQFNTWFAVWTDEPGPTISFSKRYNGTDMTPRKYEVVKEVGENNDVMFCEYGYSTASNLPVDSKKGVGYFKFDNVDLANGKFEGSFQISVESPEGDIVKLECDHFLFNRDS